METLQIECINDVVINLYKVNTEQIERGDSGYDLYYCGPTITIPPFTEQNKATMLGLGVKCQPLFHGGYYLYARSSISKTPLILANNVGIIDNGYRGEIMAAVKNMSSEPYIVESGTRLFQLSLPNLHPFKVQLVDELNTTIRGEGGFGSTNV
jgi:dUTP pyrophosphatase